MLSAEQLLDHLYYNKLPQVYRDMDSLQLTYPLKRYLSSLIEGGYAEVLKDTTGLMDLVDPEKCPSEFLPYLCESFGLEYFEDINDSYQRKFLLNIGEIIKRRGTYACIRYLVRVLTGLNVEMKYERDFEGRHLYVTLLTETLQQAENVETSVFVVERYIRTQLPYFIRPFVSFRVDTQVLQSDIYRCNLMTNTSIKYNLIPIDMRNVVNLSHRVGLAVSKVIFYDLNTIAVNMKNKEGCAMSAVISYKLKTMEVD